MDDPLNSLTFRDAGPGDVPTIIRLLAHDDLGKTREDDGERQREAYQEAFAAIDQDPNNHLIVAELDDNVIGCLQITVIPHMTYRGGKRLQIEGVRVHQAFRSQDIGHQMMVWALDFGRKAGCHLVQLTTDKLREDARRFYEKIGFEASHIGYKYHLD